MFYTPKHTHMKQLIERNQMIRADYLAMTATGTGKQAAKRLIMAKYGFRSHNTVTNIIKGHE